MVKQKIFACLSEEGRHIYRPLDRKGQKRLLGRFIRLVEDVCEVEGSV